MWGDWCSKSVQGPYGKSLWKSIRKGWPRFAANVVFKVGDGAPLKFWQDQWCGETSLSARFPELYQVTNTPEASVKDLLIFDGHNFHWDGGGRHYVLEDFLYKALTINNLRKRQLALLDWCYMCKADADVESIDHLFLHCTTARIFGV
uniref:Reverse transcriptase zinc-binding domain-containing protein n=1 Tax=Fagus sylvatica TaxID=28930 RepID=A0A2N9I5M3_FAGSY